ARYMVEVRHIGRDQVAHREYRALRLGAGGRVVDVRNQEALNAFPQTVYRVAAAISEARGNGNVTISAGVSALGCGCRVLHYCRHLYWVGQKGSEGLRQLD